MKVESIAELQIWIEGQFALVQQAQSNASDDIKAVRTRVHDLGNEVARLLALDLEGKMRMLESNDKDHDKNIRALIDEMAQRRGALAVLRALYTSVGVMAGSVLTLILERIFH